VPPIPEALLRAIAERHGFRKSDYSLIWDGGAFDPSRETHVLSIVAADGRESTVRLNLVPTSQADPWKYISKLESAFLRLARRQRSRGSN
jgi:hypothetical protein